MPGWLLPSDIVLIFRTIRCTPPQMWVRLIVGMLHVWLAGLAGERWQWSTFFPPIFLFENLGASYGLVRLIVQNTVISVVWAAA